MKITRTVFLRGLSLAAVLAIFLALLPPTTNAAPPQQGQFVYYVNYGDTLFSISQRFGTTVPAIKATNGLYSDFIYVGQRLVIPVGVSNGSSIFAPQPLPAITRTPFPPGTTACKYAVQSRDTIFSIAYRYRVTVSDLMQANYLYSPYIAVGQQLNVPCASATPAPFPAYTVVAGDNLFRIAIRNNTTIYALALVNGIPNPNIVYAGQTIVIPYPGSYVWPTNIPPAPTTTVTHMVIGEFRTRGTNGGNDEFIELFNPTSAVVNIGGWLIKGSSNTGITDTRATIPANVTLQAGQHYLIVNNNSDGGYSGSVAADLTYTIGVADDGGIALAMPDGVTMVDRVGMSAGSAYKEGSVLAALTANEDRSYARKSNGCVDTDNNAGDFVNTTPSGPQNLAAAATPCNVATATPTVTTTLAPGTPTATATQGPSAQAIVMQNISFIPSTVTLMRGSTVTWTNIDTVTHTVSSGVPGALSGLFRRTDMAPGQTYSYTFQNAGTFQYFCEIHGAAMTGTITIQ